MGYPVVSGSPNYSSTGANNTSKFIPQRWSTKLLTKFYANTAYEEISNTDYEGEIKSHALIKLRELLGHPESLHNYNVTGNGEREC